MPSTKCEWLSYPIHFLKSRGSVIRNNILEYRTKQATICARRNDFYALYATNKANIYSIGNFPAPVLTQFIVKVKRKSKKVPILKFTNFLLVFIFQM